MDTQLEIGVPICKADVKAVLGEGPLWDPRDNALYWLDIKGGRIFRYAPSLSELLTLPVDGMVSALALREDGGFVAAARDGFFRLTIDEDLASLTPIADQEADKPGNRFNDGKADLAGGFWAGTMDNAEAQVSGAFWRLGSDGHVSKLAEGFMVTNGPAFDAESKRVFLTDSAKQTIYVAATDGSDLGDMIPFLQFGDADGYPDGMEVDAEGCLWVAFWGGGCVRRFSPEGDKLADIAIPAQQPTSLAITPQGIYVTSARIGLDDAALQATPLSGGLFFIAIDRDIAPPARFTSIV